VAPARRICNPGSELKSCSAPHRPANAGSALFHARTASAMNLIWLEDFLALVSTGNFSRAAEERHMTQPAFSRRIRALEEWLGVVLVDRTTHPAVLTEAGEWFRSVAQELLARVAQVPDEARAIADASSATLRIAATHALSFTFLPSWLRSLESKMAIGPIQLVSDVMQQCEALMVQGRVQFLLCHSHDQVPMSLDANHYRSAVGGTGRAHPGVSGECPWPREVRPRYARRFARAGAGLQSRIGNRTNHPRLARRGARRDPRGIRVHRAPRLGAQDHRPGRAGHRVAARGPWSRRPRGRTAGSGG
jgi:DNA-binding transcriptional LysR family regulator